MISFIAIYLYRYLKYIKQKQTLVELNMPDSIIKSIFFFFCKKYIETFRSTFILYTHSAKKIILLLLKQNIKLEKKKLG